MLGEFKCFERKVLVAVKFVYPSSKLSIFKTFTSKEFDFFGTSC